MTKLLLYVKIIRPLNIILSLLSVLMASWLIDNITSPILPYALITVFCFASASNILNDIFDYHIDIINRPDRIIASGKLKRLDAIIAVSILYASGIMATTYLLPLGRQIALALVLPLLVFYTPIFKRIPLIGNLLIGSILGLVFLFTEGSILGIVNKMWIPFYLATGLSTLRELIKDVADIQGDAIENLQTFPRRFGIKSTLWLFRIIGIILCIYAITPWAEGLYEDIYLILLIIFVEIPLLWIMFFQLNSSSTSLDYKKSARILKGITIGGMIVIFSSGGF